MKSCRSKIVYPDCLYCLSLLNVLYPSLSICSRNPMKTQPWVILAAVRRAKCSTGCNHDDSLEDYCSIPLRLLLQFLQNFSSLYLFYLLKPLNTYRESDSLSSDLGNKMGKYIFYGFQKRLWFLIWEENIDQFFQKIC